MKCDDWRVNNTKTWHTRFKPRTCRLKFSSMLRNHVKIRHGWRLISASAALSRRLSALRQSSGFNKGRDWLVEVAAPKLSLQLSSRCQPLAPPENHRDPSFCQPRRITQFFKPPHQDRLTRLFAVENRNQIKMDYDPMVMDDAESLGPVIKISQVCPAWKFCCKKIAMMKAETWDLNAENHHF